MSSVDRYSPSKPCSPKGKVWVVVLKPTIFIRAEHDELKRQEKKP